MFIPFGGWANKNPPRRTGRAGLSQVVPSLLRPATSSLGRFLVAVVIGDADFLASKRGNCARVPIAGVLVVALHLGTDHPIVWTNLVGIDGFSLAIIIANGNLSAANLLGNAWEPVSCAFVVPQHPIARRLSAGKSAAHGQHASCNNNLVLDQDPSPVAQVQN